MKERPELKRIVRWCRRLITKNKKRLALSWHVRLSFIFALIFSLGFVGEIRGEDDINLLLNGGFEESFLAHEAGMVPVGWTPFWVIEGLDDPDNSNGRVPEYMDGAGATSPAVRLFSGGHALLWHTKFSTAFAGVYQQVPVEAGTSLKLTAQVYGWSSNGGDIDFSAEPAWVRQRVGIDPTGGTDPMGLTVMWSLPHQFVDEWGKLSIDAEAQSGGHVTVFLAAYPNRARPQNDIYFDEAVLRPLAYDLPLVEPKTAVGAEERAVDPILLGLVVEQGTGPGQQGVRVDRANVQEFGDVGRGLWVAGLAGIGVICLLGAVVAGEGRRKKDFYSYKR